MCVVKSDPDPESRPVFEPLGTIQAPVGSLTVRRVLPRRGRRTIGSWWIIDVMVPAPRNAMSIGEHPNLGMPAVTGQNEGEGFHRKHI